MTREYSVRQACLAGVTPIVNHVFVLNACLASKDADEGV